MHTTTFFMHAIVLIHCRENLLPIAMAAANAWGLLLSTVMMGYGLVEVPRGLWFDADIDWCLRYTEFTAPGVKEAMVDAEADLYEVARVIMMIDGLSALISLTSCQMVRRKYPLHLKKLILMTHSDHTSTN